MNEWLEWSSGCADVADSAADDDDSVPPSNGSAAGDAGAGDGDL